MPPDPLSPSAGHWARIAEVFDAVVDLAPEASAVALDRLCTTASGEADTALRAEVEAMLDADATAQTSADAFDLPAAAALVNSDTASGERIGPWRVLRAIGRGGMGRVDLVERADGAYEQRAALKRLSLVAPSRLKRFLRERQILASLQHPGIARLLDGGVASGAPYLVMEYVDGEPITRHADAHGLGLRQRLDLFVQVCDAVAYAHRHLVVHRDIKPSNVLVGTRASGATDGAETPEAPDEARVSLLDFGVARLLDPTTHDEITQEAAGAPLTPGYAAPEQIQGGAITTATDVWALGVLLYELITGERPFKGETRDVWVAAVLNSEPTAPSHVAMSRTQAQEAATVALTRSEAKRLRGDLDVICQKALAKEPADRYHSAETLGADIERWLRGDPIVARAPSLAYRARRFVSRHRTPVGIGTLALLALVVAMASWLRADREQATAQQAQADADAVLETQGELLRVLQPSTRAQEDSLLDVPPDIAETIEQAIQTVEATQADAPGVLAGNLLELGTTLFERGQLDRADSLFARSLALRRPLRREGDQTVYMALIGRGHVAKEQSENEAARGFYREALEMERETPKLNAQSGLSNLEMWIAETLDDSEKSERVLLETLADRRAALATSSTGQTQLMAAQAHNNLGAHYFNQSDFRSAFSEFQAAERIARRVLGELHPSANRLRGNLSYTAAAMGRYDEAERHARLALDAAKRGGHGDNIEASMHQAIGQALYFQGQYEGAEHELRAADALRANADPDGASEGRRGVQTSLVAVLAVQGRLSEALAMSEAIETSYRQKGTLGDPDGILAQSRSDGLRFARGRRDGAIERLTGQARAIRRNNDAPADTRAFVLHIAGDALRESGNAEEAEPLLREALAAIREAHPDEYSAVRRLRLDYGRALAALGRLDEARPHLEAARGHVRDVRYPSTLESVDAEIDRLLRKATSE